MYTFSMFCKYFSIKSNPKLCHTYKVTNSPKYNYLIQTIDFIAEEIKKRLWKYSSESKRKVKK